MAASFALCPICFKPFQPRARSRCSSCHALVAGVPAYATLAEAERAARDDVREPARLAAALLRAGQADRAMRGACSTTFMDARPKYWHRHEWANLPGFVKTIEGSTRNRTKQPVTTYSHRLLPGWEYDTSELWELLQDLDNLAAGRGWPTSATSPSRAVAPNL